MSLSPHGPERASADALADSWDEYDSEHVRMRLEIRRLGRLRALWIHSAETPAQLDLALVESARAGLLVGLHVAELGGFSERALALHTACVVLQEVAAELASVAA